jgi:hypothetical protein
MTTNPEQLELAVDPLKCYTPDNPQHMVTTRTGSPHREQDHKPSEDPTAMIQKSDAPVTTVCKAASHLLKVRSLEVLVTQKTSSKILPSPSTTKMNGNDSNDPPTPTNNAFGAPQGKPILQLFPAPAVLVIQVDLPQYPSSLSARYDKIHEHTTCEHNHRLQPPSSSRPQVSKHGPCQVYLHLHHHACIYT